MKTAAVFHTRARHTEYRELQLSSPKAGEVLIEALCSAISPGTESMIYRGHLSSGILGDSIISCLQSQLEYPFRYGYALVGRITDTGENVDPAWLGRTIFTFHPHQKHALVAIADCIEIPEGISEYDALFLPNMESALNFVMDANPVFGSRVMIFGLGVVGLLSLALFRKLPLSRLIAADPLEYRRRRALDLGLVTAIDPLDQTQWAALLQELFDGSDGGGLDLALELSGNLEALNQAIEVTGFSGTVVLGSWYGSQSQSLDLGGAFHRRRIRLLSSQVSTIDPGLSGRWTKQRRFDLAFDLIRELRPCSLITHRFAPEDCDLAFRITSQRLEQALQVIFEYR